MFVQTNDSNNDILTFKFYFTWCIHFYSPSIHTNNITNERWHYSVPSTVNKFTIALFSLVYGVQNASKITSKDIFAWLRGHLCKQLHVVTPVTSI